MSAAHTTPAAQPLRWRDLPDFEAVAKDLWSADAVTLCMLSHLRTHEQAPGLQPAEFQCMQAMVRTLHRLLSPWSGSLVEVAGAHAADDLVGDAAAAGVPSLLALADDLADAEGVALTLSQYLDAVVSSAYSGNAGESVYRTALHVASMLAGLHATVCRAPAYALASKGGAA